MPEASTESGGPDAPEPETSIVDSGGPDASHPPTDAAMEAEAGLPPPTKMDILFVVDNSRGMADEQQLLSLAMPGLLNGLLDPACVDATRKPITSGQPGPTGACPAGSQRSFPVIYDAHVGFVSTSLGSFGANACPEAETTSCPGGATNTSQDDHGHLVSRADPCASATVPTYQSEGFLAWDAQGQLSPPGQTVLGDGSAPGLVQSAQNLTRGIGALGCGFSSQDEAWYRFLVDPAPYQTIMLNGQNVVTSGTDSLLLQQRGQFLRPDSLLVIVTMSSRTESSLKETSFYPLFAQETSNGLPFHLPHPSTTCSTKGPSDPCCYSCGQSVPAGCTADPACSSSPSYTDTDENVSIRSFGLASGLASQKARYGIEFFDPPSRYVQALTSATVQNEMSQTVPNPIFVGGMRDPSRVLYAAITGVPWQLVARADASGQPDLVDGVDALDSTQVGGFKTAAELALKDAHGNTFWDDIAGDPEHYVPSLSPFMVESTVPRTGTDPITGIAISPSSSPNGTNPINGHEWNVPSPPGDIQYACVFPKLQPVDCSQAGVVCDCPLGTSSENNPLCDPNPNDSGNPTLQTRAKAYPGIKQLAIAKGLGAQGIVASACAKQVTDSTQVDYAYAPSASAIVARVGAALRGP